MIKIPTITELDVAFGNINHLPKWEDIPEEFKNFSGVANDIAEDWFFGKLTEETMPQIKEGLDKNMAMAAIRAILVSFQPKHEHKIAGVAYLINEWFELNKQQI